MLEAGSFEPKWQTTLFTLLPKSADTSKPNSWRPIAVLKLTAKLLAKMICARLRDCLDAHQSMDQTGFRDGAGLEDAYFVYESLCSKGLEWNAPLWFASLDLTKAFDRVEYDPLLTALLEQGVPKVYCALLRVLHQQQCGSLHGGKTFAIQRGV